MDTNGDDESEVADLKPRIQRPRSPRKAPAPRRSVAEMIGEPAESGAIAEEPAVAEPQHEAEAAGADEWTPRGLRRRRKQAQHRGDASLKAGVGRRPQDARDIELTAKVEAAQLRFREVPRTEIHFSGTPNCESSTVNRRRNLPDRVSKDIDYHDVQVDYLLTNRLRTATPLRNSKRTAGSDMSPRP